MRPQARPALWRKPFSREAKAVIDNFTTRPSNRYARSIDTTLRKLVMTGDFADAFLIYDLSAEAEDQAFINWKNPGSNTLTKAGSVTHTPNRGCAATGAVADGLQTGWNPSTSGVGADNSSATVWSNTTVIANTYFDWGLQNAQALGRLRVAGDTGNWRLWGSANLSLPTGVTDTTGMWTHNRPASNLAQVFRNGTQQGADIAMTSSVVQNSTLNILNATVGSTVSSPRQHAMFTFAKGRSAAREAAFYEIWLNHMRIKGNA